MKVNKDIGEGIGCFFIALAIAVIIVALKYYNQ